MGLGGPEEDHQLHHCCWTGRVGEREESEDWHILLIQSTHPKFHYGFKRQRTPPKLRTLNNWVNARNQMYRCQIHIELTFVDV